MISYKLRNGNNIEIEDTIAYQIRKILGEVSEIATKPCIAPHLIRKGRIQLEAKRVYESHLEFQAIEELRQEGFLPSDFNDPRHSLIQYGVSEYGLTQTAPQSRLHDLFRTTADYFSDRFVWTHINFLDSHITIHDPAYLDAPLPYEARCNHAFAKLMDKEAQLN